MSGENTCRQKIKTGEWCIKVWSISSLCMCLHEGSCNCIPLKNTTYLLFKHISEGGAPRIDVTTWWPVTIKVDIDLNFLWDRLSIGWLSYISNGGAIMCEFVFAEKTINSFCRRFPLYSPVRQHLFVVNYVQYFTGKTQQSGSTLNSSGRFWNFYRVEAEVRLFLDGTLCSKLSC